MIIMIFTAICTVFSFSFFSLNLSIQGMNRSIIYTPFSILYNEVNTELVTPEFDCYKVMESLDKYYSTTISKYCKSYQTLYYFYNPEDESMCLKDKCKGFEVIVIAKLAFNYRYSRTMYYELTGDLHGQR